LNAILNDNIIDEEQIDEEVFGQVELLEEFRKSRLNLNKASRIDLDKLFFSVLIK